MAKFGQHETAQRLHLSGVGGLFALAADDKKVVKVLLPPAGVWSEGVLRAEIDGFLLRYKLQRLLAKASKYWAPVHEVAGIRDEEFKDHYRAAGAYAVLDRHERSLHSLIEGRVHVESLDLRNLFTGILQGLLDCRNTLKRPHGDLKPANILLKDSANLTTATVHLTDPAPDGALNGNADNKDLADLGKILYELVNLRPFAGGTIGPSKDWSRLGPNGEDWRKLCGALLDPHAPPDERDLEKILPRIATWTLKPKKSKAPLIAAAVFLLLIAGGVTTFLLLKPPKPKWDEAKWDELCLDSHAWFQDFYVDAKSPETLVTLNGDGRYPKNAVDLITDALKKRAAKTQYYLPVEIAQDNSGGEIRQLIVMPTNEAKIHPGPAYTLVSLKLVHDIQDALKPEGWPLLQKLQHQADTYEKDRHWQAPADDLRIIAAATQPPELPAGPDALSRYDAIKPHKNIVHALETTVHASDAVNNIETAWVAIEANIKTIQTLETTAHASVPILDGAPDFARALPTAGTQPDRPKDMSSEAALTDIEGFAGKLTPAATTLADIAATLTKQKIDVAELAKAPVAQAQPSVDNYKAFAARVPDYAVIEDPRQNAAWTSAINEIKGIVEIIQQTAPTDPEIAAINKGLADQQAVINQTNTLALISLNRPYFKRNIDGDDGYPGIAKSLKLLRDRGINDPNYIDPPKEKAFLAETLAHPPKEIAGASPAVLDQWKKAQQKLIDTFSPLDDTTFRHQYRHKMVERLYQAYADLEKQLSPRVPALDLKSAPAWQSKIAAHLASRFHDEALVKLVTDYTAQYAPQAAPELTDPGYQSFVKAHLQTYLVRCNTGRDFIAGYATIENALNGLYLNRNEPAPNAPYWSDLAAQLTKAEFLPDDQVTAALKDSGLADRIANLQSLVAATDYTKIEPALAAEAPELVLTAWRKLATIQLPESATYLDADAKAQERLKAIFAKLPDPARAQLLSAELSAGIPMHWHHWAANLTTPELIGVALQRRPKDAPLRLPGEDDRLVYDNELFQLGQQFTSLRTTIPDFKTRDAALKKVTSDFLDTVNKTPFSPEVQKAAALDKLITTLRKPLDAKSADIAASTKAGPALANWGSEIDNNTGVARFFFPATGTREFTLEFRRLPDQADGRTAYLCTTELPLEVFAFALNEPTPRATALNKPNWLNINDDSYVTWTGVRGWQVAGNLFRSNSDWLCKTTLMQKYADVPQGAKAYEPPGPQMPIQRISPWLALYTAHLLGCRLPTAPEWTSALNTFELHQPGPKDWNLRGNVFAAQTQYVKSLNTNDLYVAWPYPDKDIFDTVKSIGKRSENAPIWLPDELVKLAPDALSRANADTLLANSTLWFRKVPTQPTTGIPPMHDLIGNVAEYCFDSPAAGKALSDKDVQSVTTASIESEIDAGTLAIAGGSSLSSPLVPPTVPERIAAGSLPLGRCDVGMRLAFTAPIESIESVLAHLFATPKYLPAPAVASSNAASTLQPQ
ncbi:MAG: hypothetical protein ACTHN5_01345 [Phycisphaerae bacterium]